MKKDYFQSLSEEGFHRVAYFEWGEHTEAEIPVICVHGLTRNAHDFDALASTLSQKGRHVFCPDVVGRGDSDWLKSALHYTYEQYILDMTTMIARTEGHQVDWIGTSMGGLIGMILASLPGSPISRLVLNDVGPQIPVRGMQRLLRYAGRDPIFDSMERAKRYFKIVYADFGQLTDDQWQYFTETSVREVEPGKYISKVDPGVKISPAKSKIAWNALLHPQRALEGTLFDIDLWDIWRKVTCPVLVIHGKKSDILTAPVLEKMQHIHLETEVIEVENAGHAPALLDQVQHEIIHEWLLK